MGRLFVKPTFGVGGKGIEVFDLREGEVFAHVGRAPLDAAYVEELKGTSGSSKRAWSLIPRWLPFIRMRSVRFGSLPGTRKTACRSCSPC
ncbi:MAG: hypothetical protein ACLR8Y_18200 [Alistipes indistinctus]